MRIISKQIDFARGDTLPDFWLDRLQELQAAGSWGLKLEKATATSIRVPAGPNDDQVGVIINGVWRYMAASVTASHPGGVAGLYDVFVTGSNNNFTGVSPNIDLTHYAFALTIKPQGYSWTVGDPPKRRKIGYVSWDGAAIEDVRLITGSRSPAWRGILSRRPAASAENEGLFYLVTDQQGGTLYRSTGSTWEKTAPGVTEALTPGPHAATHLAAGSDALAWTTIHGVGTLAARPAAASSNAGYLYLATDVDGGTLYRSNGSSWVQAGLGPTSYQTIAQNILLFGTFGALPAPTSANRYFYYFATDTKVLYQNQTGSTWATLFDGSTLPTVGEKQALVGTAGSPSSSNRYVTEADQRIIAPLTVLKANASADVSPVSAGLWTDVPGCSLSLAEGLWDVSARAYFYANGVNNMFGECRLRTNDGTVYDQGELFLVDGNGAGRVEADSYITAPPGGYTVTLQVRATYLASGSSGKMLRFPQYNSSSVATTWIRAVSLRDT